MAFRTNDTQQYSLTDSVNGLTLREQKSLEKSWAKVFADDIYPAIGRRAFLVLYSTKKQLRGITLVNICIGAPIIIRKFLENWFPRCRAGAA